MNPIAKFYNKFNSGDDKFTITTGRHFNVIFSFPYLANVAGAAAKSALKGGLVGGITGGGGFGSVAGAAKGAAGGLIKTAKEQIPSALKMNRHIGLNMNLTPRFDKDDIQYIIRNVNLPNFKLSDAETNLTSDTTGGTYSIPGLGTVEPESTSFSIDFIPTVESPIEGFFIPWMEEVMYSNASLMAPFRRANIFINVYNENNLGNYSDGNIACTYSIYGAYPNFCDTPNLSHESVMDNRSVGFKFNTMSVTSDFTKGKNGLLSNVTSFGKSFAGGSNNGLDNYAF